MSSSDVLVLAQTIILLLTGCVIVWYTLETRRIRKETTAQNRLLAEQLRLLEEEHHSRQREKLSFVRPVFRATGGTISSDVSQLKFTNKGGPIQDLAVTASERTAKVSPRDYVGTGEEFRVQVKPGGVPGLRFTLEYNTTLDDRRATVFTHDQIENRWTFADVDA